MVVAGYKRVRIGWDIEPGHPPGCLRRCGGKTFTLEFSKCHLIALLGNSCCVFEKSEDPDGT